MAGGLVRASSLRELDNDYADFHKFRVFRHIKHLEDPAIDYRNPEWTTSPETFHRKYTELKKIYDSEAVKVKLCRTLDGDVSSGL
jgi:hypothetical protein